MKAIYQKAPQMKGAKYMEYIQSDRERIKTKGYKKALSSLPS